MIMLQWFQFLDYPPPLTGAEKTDPTALSLKQNSCHKIKIILVVNYLEAGVSVGFNPVARCLCFLLL